MAIVSEVSQTTQKDDMAVMSREMQEVASYLPLLRNLHKQAQTQQTPTETNNVDFQPPPIPSRRKLVKGEQYQSLIVPSGEARFHLPLTADDFQILMAPAHNVLWSDKTWKKYAVRYAGELGKLNMLPYICDKDLFSRPYAKTLTSHNINEYCKCISAFFKCLNVAERARFLTDAMSRGTIPLVDFPLTDQAKVYYFFKKNIHDPISALIHDDLVEIQAKKAAGPNEPTQAQRENYVDMIEIREHLAERNEYHLNSIREAKHWTCKKLHEGSIGGYVNMTVDGSLQLRLDLSEVALKKEDAGDEGPYLDMEKRCVEVPVNNKKYGEHTITFTPLAWSFIEALVAKRTEFGQRWLFHSSRENCREQYRHDSASFGKSLKNHLSKHFLRDDGSKKRVGLQRLRLALGTEHAMEAGFPEFHVLQLWDEICQKMDHSLQIAVSGSYFQKTLRAEFLENRKRMAGEVEGAEKRQKV